MFKVTADSAHNVMIISFEGAFTLDDAKRWYDDIEGKVAQVKKGFSILADLSLLDNMDPSVQKWIEKAMELLNRHGVSKVVRIIPDPGRDIGFKILSLFHYSRDVKIHTCASIHEALGYFL